MKLSILILIFALGMATHLHAQQLPDSRVAVHHWQMTRNGNYLDVEMDLQLDSLNVAPNRAVLITPRFCTSADSLEMKPVGIYSRTRYYHYLRSNGAGLIGGSRETGFRSSKVPASLPYHDLVNYEPWMEGARLNLLCQEYGCCHTVLREWQIELGIYHTPQPPIYRPLYVYVKPRAELSKERRLSGSAYVAFPVKGTDILPDFRQNRVELQKILSTIDSVKNDPDIRLQSVSIRGYASPEGTYASNRRLAESRTASLKRYVEGLYHFDKDFIRISSEPENWAGLRAYLLASGLPQTADLLQLVDSDMQPDDKERQLRVRWPEIYRRLLAECYPALRRTDYQVQYVIRTFTDVDEIRQVMQLQPQKLSLNEFYQLADTYEAGSREFNEVFETAVRMYPTDSIANLNAANSAMSRHDYAYAERYLKRAGQSPQAVYAKGVYAAIRKDYVTARACFAEARQAGIAEAANGLEQLERLAGK